MIPTCAQLRTGFFCKNFYKKKRTFAFRFGAERECDKIDSRGILGSDVQ